MLQVCIDLEEPGDSKAPANEEIQKDSPGENDLKLDRSNLGTSMKNISKNKMQECLGFLLEKGFNPNAFNLEYN